jgi:hypothetical protein
MSYELAKSRALLPMQIVARRRLFVLVGLCVAYFLSGHWDQLIPSHFTIQTVYAWCWYLLVSFFFSVCIRSFFFSYDVENQKFPLTVKMNHLIPLFALLLLIDLTRHFRSFQHPPSILYLTLGSLYHVLGDLFLASILALGMRVTQEFIKNARRPKLLPFLTFATAIFGFIAYFGRKDLLAVQPGGVTIAMFLTDLVFALALAYFLHGLLVRTFAPAQTEVLSVIPHQPYAPPDERNSVTASGV